MSSKTEQAIAEMLTEPTGRSFLDSGGAYGRNWERNAGQTVESFKAQPEATIDRWGCVSISNFHYLTDRLHFEPELDDIFVEFAAREEYESDSWLSIAEEFARSLNEPEVYGTAYGMHCDRVQTYNSYNGECLLDQTIQWVEFTFMDQRHVLLQIHGGCDVRGGYTRPRVFTFRGDDEYAFYDYADAQVYCEGTHGDQVVGQVTIDGDVVRAKRHTHHAWDIRSNRVEETFVSGMDEFDRPFWDNVELPELDDLETGEDEQGRDNGKPLCPVCSAPLYAVMPRN